MEEYVSPVEMLEKEMRDRLAHAEESRRQEKRWLILHLWDMMDGVDMSEQYNRGFTDGLVYVINLLEGAK